MGEEAEEAKNEAEDKKHHESYDIVIIHTSVTLGYKRPSAEA
jgi:hypothetical protein